MNQIDPQQIQQESEEVHLRDYLQVISKRRKLVAIVSGLIFIAVALYTYSLTPQYRATTKVLIEKAVTNDLTGNNGGRIYDPEFYETQFELIRSRAVASRVVESLDLVSRFNSSADDDDGGGLFSWFADAKAVLKAILGGSAQPGEEEIADETIKASDRLIQGVSVQPFKNSRIVTISYLSPQPQFAATVANQLAQAYLQETLEMKLNATRMTLDWMTKKAEEEAAKLETAERKLQQYMVENDIVTLEDRLAITPQQLSQISGGQVEAESRRKQLEALYDKIKSVGRDYNKAQTIPAINSDPVLQTIRAQILEREQEILELSGKYGQKHPAMKKAVADLNILKQKRNQEIDRIIQSIRNEYELARTNEQNLQAQMQRTKAEAQGINERFIQYGVLKREVDTNRQMYDALLMKIKEQSITQDTQPVTVWIVEQAAVPEVPVKPNKRKNLLLGLILALMAGVGLAFFIEYLDNTIKYPEETEKQLGIPVLGLVSLWKDKDKPIEKVVLDAPRSTFAESYRGIRTALLLSSSEGAPEKILMTSAVAQAGKTTSVINLACALAQSGKRVLLIDADMRKPRVHKVLGLNNSKGLSNYLAGGESNILKRGALDNLAVITSGPIPPNPSELLSSTRMHKLLDNLSSEFDVILCDSPPLLSVADGRILARVFDATVLVVRARFTTVDLARRAVKLLTDINAPILGMIINALELDKNDYYYQYYYGAYSTYGEDPETEKA